MSDLPRSAPVDLPAPLPADERSSLARRPLAREERAAPPRRVHAAADAATPRSAAAAATRRTVRRAVADAGSLRTAVVVAEILGAPRALRPYGVSEPG